MQLSVALINEPCSVSDFLLKKVLSSKSVHYVFHIVKDPKLSLHFVWKISEKESEIDVINENLNVIRSIERNERRIKKNNLKLQFKAAYGFVGSAVSFPARGVSETCNGENL